MKKIAVVACMAVIATSYAQEPAAPRSELTLDVVPFRYVQRLPRPERVRPRMLDDGEPPPALSAELLPLGQSVFAWGDEFEFRLRIKNVGSIPVVLPWAADGLIPEETDHATAHVHRALASIEIESLDGEQKFGSLDHFALAGSAMMPGSLERLAPGETALLRLPAQWTSSRADLGRRAALERRVLSEPMWQVRVRGTLVLIDALASATSANAETVIVVKSP